MLLVLPCGHSLCRRCVRRRSTSGYGECAVSDCKHRFRAADAKDVVAAEAEAMRQESQARKRVAAAFPKVLEDFLLPGVDIDSAMALYDRYCEEAEELVGRLLDRSTLPASHSGQAQTVAEAALADLKAAEARGGRDVSQAAARQRRLAAQAAQDVASAEAEAEALARAMEAEDVRAQARTQRKRVRLAMSRVPQADGDAAAESDNDEDDDGDDDDGDVVGVQVSQRDRGLTSSALAGVTAASASGSRMRRPAMPHIAPPRPLDRSTAPPAHQDARDASDDAMEAVKHVEEAARAREWAAARGSIAVLPNGRAASRDKLGGAVSSALGTAAKKRLREWVAARQPIGIGSTSQ